MFQDLEGLRKEFDDKMVELSLTQTTLADLKGNFALTKKDLQTAQTENRALSLRVEALENAPCCASNVNVPYLYDFLRLVDASECPADGNLDNCDAVKCGELCEGDGEMTTSDNANNCPSSYDIYQRVCSDTLPPVLTTTPTAMPTDGPTNIGSTVLRLVDASECPAILDIDDCTTVQCGQLCEGDGEPGTDDNHDNCSGYDIYMRECNLVPCGPGGLRALTAAECPDDPDLPDCDTVACGELCEADSADCFGTDSNLDNCDSKVGSSTGFDVYEMVCSGMWQTSHPSAEPRQPPTDTPTAEPIGDPTRAPTRAPTAEPTTRAPTRAPTSPDDYLRLLDPSECPQDPDITNCDNIKCGETCEGDGEPGTDDGHDNCGVYDVYQRECAELLDCPDKARRLRPLDPSECPADSDLPDCDAVACGEFCEADNNICGSDTNLDNCGSSGYDVYQVMCIDSEPATEKPSSDPTELPTQGGDYLRLLDPSECPVDPDLGDCTNIGCGEICEGDGEPGTDDNHDNCGAYDVYVRECPNLLDCPDNTKRLRPLDPSECPDDPDLPNCDTVACGEMCEADGECGSDTSLNNCDSKVGGTTGYDVYRLVCLSGLVATAPPSRAPSRAPTKAPSAPPSDLRLLDPAECPAESNILLLPNCDNIKCGELCEGDGEAGTDSNHDNCGLYDVYQRECAELLDCPDTTRRLRPVDPSECPADSNIDDCDTVGCGDFCEADGECNSDTNLDNCGSGYDVYQVMCIEPATQPPSSAPTDLPTQGGDYLRLIDPSECPADADIGNCDGIQCGDLCEGDGELTTVDNADNCSGGYDVYMRMCGAPVALLPCGPGKLRALDPSECPSDSALLAAGTASFSAMPNCDAVSCGDLCEADNDVCNTDGNLDNCGSSGYDVYEMVCDQYLRLVPIDKSECPADSDIDNCDLNTMACGDLCEGDGELTTDDSIDNCGLYDVYRKECNAGNPGGVDYLRLIDSADCPANADLDNCDIVQCGELCEGDGEMTTDDNDDNCGAYDVYMRECANAPNPTNPPTDPPTNPPTNSDPTQQPTLWPQSYLVHVAAADCPVDRDIDNCEQVACGDMCEGDGEPGTIDSLDNCGPYDIYKRICEGVQPGPSTGYLRPVDSSECPSDPDIGSCDPVPACGAICEGDGEGETDDGLDNCNGYDIYEHDCDVINCGAGFLREIDPTECPDDPDLPACDAVACGELCEGDGECGTDTNLDVCDSKVGGTTGYDVYQYVCSGQDNSVITLTQSPTREPTPAPTVKPTATPTAPVVTLPCGPGQIRPLSKADCPSDPDLPACDTVACGEMCEGDGECGTNTSLDNCDATVGSNTGFDVYIMECAVVNLLTCGVGGLEPVAVAQCPADPDLPSCDTKGITCGDMCEADGECGTDTSLNNCDSQVGGTTDFDVYRMVCNNGNFHLYEIDPADCPLDPDLKKCDKNQIKCGDLCEGDGELTTDDNVDNCGAYDVYRKMC